MNRTRNSGDETSRTWRLLTMSHRRNLVPTSATPRNFRVAKLTARRGLFALLLVGILAAGLAGYGALGTPETAGAQGGAPPLLGELSLNQDDGRPIFNPTGIWSDGSTMWVADWGANNTQRLYAYNLSTKVRIPAKDLHLPVSQSPQAIWSDGSTIWVASKKSLRRPNVFERPRFAGRIVAYDLATKAHLKDKDFDLGEDVNNPVGIWSDGSTMWVSNLAIGKLLAYEMATKRRVPTRDIGLHGNNNSQRNIWSDGVTIWVVDQTDTKLYAYDIATKDYLPKRDIDLHADNNYPRGIWSNGTTMWVVNEWSRDVQVSKLYYYSVAAVSGISIVNGSPRNSVVTVSITAQTAIQSMVYLRYRTAAVNGGASGEWLTDPPQTAANNQAEFRPHGLPGEDGVARGLSPGTRYEVQASLDPSFPTAFTRSATFTTIQFAHVSEISFTDVTPHQATATAIISGQLDIRPTVDIETSLRYRTAAVGNGAPGPWVVAVVKAENSRARFTLTGLSPGTRYEVESALGIVFVEHPAQNPHSATFVTGSIASLSSVSAGPLGPELGDMSGSIGRQGPGGDNYRANALPLRGGG